MKASAAGLQFIKQEEGLVLHAYPDPATGNEPWTIGYGSTAYEDGRPIKKGDLITAERAEVMLQRDADIRAVAMGALIKSTLTQNQFDALLSFAYNCGMIALQKSRLLKKVNKNPQDPTIKNEFMRWVYAAGKVDDRLLKRRKREAGLYFTT